MTHHAGKAREIQVREWLQVVQRRWAIVLACAIVCTSLGVFYNSLPRTPQYQVAARVVLNAEVGLFNTLKVLMREPIVMEKVADELNLRRSPGALAAQTGIVNVNETQVVLVTVVDADPKIAAGIANATVNVFREVAREKLGFSGMTLLSEADGTLPYAPINPPKTTRNIILAVMAGLILGLGAAFFRDSLDDSIRADKHDQELLGLPVLGAVSRIKRKPSSKRTKQLTAAITSGGESVGS
ncbi:YveK family protein [Paenibacillus aurantiacus]|uniref:YveK family protein n=1 Tax=Paenibacillus aurantiacus TaxID=1936118 RepID=A0ABV5KII9_9BACL